MEALFSENEAVPDIIDDVQIPPIRIPTNSAATSSSGTSARLLTNPSLTDKLSNFPIWPLIDNSILNHTVRDNDAESPISGDEREPMPPATVTSNAKTTTNKPTGALRGHQHHRQRGRPPGRARPRTSLPRGHQQRGTIRGARKRGRPRGRPPRTTRIKPNTSTSVRNALSVDTDTSAPSAAVTSDQALPPESTNAR